MIFLFFFFFNDTATTEIYTLSLHDALPICASGAACPRRDRSRAARRNAGRGRFAAGRPESSWGSSFAGRRSEEHTSELQSRLHLVCRLLLEKKKKKKKNKKSEEETGRNNIA